MKGNQKEGREKISLRAWLAVGILALLLLVILVYTVSRVLHTYPTQARRVGMPMPVELSRVTSRELLVAVGASSTTVPFREVKVVSEIPGTITEIPVKIGERVSPQTLVVRLEDKEYQAALRQAEAALQSAREQLRVARLNLDRYSALYHQKLIPLAELEKYQLAFATAQTTQAQAYHDLVMAQRHLAATKIYSPVHGVLTAELAHVGEFVDKDSPLVSLGQITPLLVQAKVPEEKIKAVQLKQEVRVTFDAFPGQTFVGQVFKIDPTTDPNTRVFSAYVELANPDQFLSLGLTGYTRMEHRVQGLAVPSIAIIDLFAEPVLFVVKEDIARLRRIVPGGIASGYTWIKEGLAEGEEVVVAGQRYLKDGDRVREGSK